MADERLSPLIFTDFDDVLVLGQHGANDVFASNPPPELWSSLFHTLAAQTLLSAIEEHAPRIILTTSWLKRGKTRQDFEQLLRKTTLAPLAEHLHPAWSVMQKPGETRAEAVERWLKANHRGERFVILDDTRSGTGLEQSQHFRAGRVVLCQAGSGVGLHAGHLAIIRNALKG